MGRAAKGDGSIFKTDTGYRGYVTVNGHRKYTSGAKKTEVAQKLREIKNQRDTGVLTLGRSPKLSAWVEHWMKATEPTHTIKTHAGYRFIIDTYLPAWLADVTLQKLTAEHLEDAYATLREKGLSGSTIYQLHSIIRASLTVAVKRGRVGVNVAKLVVAPPKPEPARVVPFSDADLTAIFRVLAESRSKARWVLGLELGLRPGEALALEWSHIDFRDGSIRVCQQVQTVEKRLRLVGYAKTDAGNRIIPMPRHVAAVLTEQRVKQLEEMSSSAWEQWRDESEPEGTVHAFVFTSARRPGWPITPTGDAQQWTRLLGVAGLPHAKPYTARHTAASRMIAAGIDLTVVAEILGHANVNVLIKTYAHALEERKRAAAGLLEAAWAAPYPAPYEADSARFGATQGDQQGARPPRNYAAERP